jgi:hypothetical protein
LVRQLQFLSFLPDRAHIRARMLNLRDRDADHTQKNRDDQRKASIQTGAECEFHVCFSAV